MKIFYEPVDLPPKYICLHLGTLVCFIHSVTCPQCSLRTLWWGVCVCLCVHTYAGVYKHTWATLFCEWNRSPLSKIHVKPARNTSTSGSVRLMVWFAEQRLQFRPKHKANPQTGTGTACLTAASLTVCAPIPAPRCNPVPAGWLSVSFLCCTSVVVVGPVVKFVR